MEDKALLKNMTPAYFSVLPLNEFLETADEKNPHIIRAIRALNSCYKIRVIIIIILNLIKTF